MHNSGISIAVFFNSEAAPAKQWDCMENNASGAINAHFNYSATNQPKNTTLFINHCINV